MSTETWTEANTAAHNLRAQLVAAHVAVLQSHMVRNEFDRSQEGGLNFQASADQVQSQIVAYAGNGNVLSR